MNLPAELAAIRALDAARTPGKWKQALSLYGVASKVVDISTSPVIFACCYCDSQDQTHNAAFIAASPRMAALIEELAAENERLRNGLLALAQMKQEYFAARNAAWTALGMMDSAADDLRDECEALSLLPATNKLIAQIADLQRRLAEANSATPSPPPSDEQFVVAFGCSEAVIRSGTGEDVCYPDDLGCLPVAIWRIEDVDVTACWTKEALRCEFTPKPGRKPLYGESPPQPQPAEAGKVDVVPGSQFHWLDVWRDVAIELMSREEISIANKEARSRVNAALAAKREGV